MPASLIATLGSRRHAAHSPTTTRRTIFSRRDKKGVSSPIAALLIVDGGEGVAAKTQKREKPEESRRTLRARRCHRVLTAPHPADDWRPGAGGRPAERRRPGREVARGGGGAGGGSTGAAGANRSAIRAPYRSPPDANEVKRPSVETRPLSFISIRLRSFGSLRRQTAHTPIHHPKQKTRVPNGRFSSPKMAPTNRAVAVRRRLRRRPRHRFFTVVVAFRRFSQQKAILLLTIVKVTIKILSKIAE